VPCPLEDWPNPLAANPLADERSLLRAALDIPPDIIITDVTMRR
jgi:hypothetical protein